MRKTITIIMIMILMLGVFGGCVNAAASVGASPRTVNEGSAVTVTVSFGQKVSAAQFVLNYNSSILQYSSYSCGGSGFKEFNAGSGRFGYAGTTTDVSSVSFRFTARAQGTANVSVSGLKISTATQSGVSASMGNSSTTITVTEKTQSGGNTGSNQGNNGGSGSQTNKPQQKPSSNSQQQKPNTNNTNNNSNQTNTNANNDTTKEDEAVVEPVELAPNELITIEREDVVTIKDETTNVMIKGLPIAIQNDIRLKINELKENKEQLQKIEEILKEIEGKKQYFDIQLFKNDERIQPNGYVTVYLPIPEGYNKDQLKAYYVDEENGKYELIEGKVQDNYYTFTTDHFSVYALVETPTETVEETEGVSLLDRINEFFENTTVLYIIIGILILCIIIITIRMNRLKNN